MGALSGAIGAMGGAVAKGGVLGKAMSKLPGMQGPLGVAGQLPGLGGLMPGQTKLPAGAGGGPPIAMSATPGTPATAPAAGGIQAGQPGLGDSQRPQVMPQLGGAPFGGMLGGALTAGKALGRTPQNPRLQPFFGVQPPASGPQNPWAAPPTPNPQG